MDRQTVLDRLQGENEFTTVGMDQKHMQSILLGLQDRLLVTFSQVVEMTPVLTVLGTEFITSGSEEFRIYSALPMPLAAVAKEYSKFGLAAGFKLGWMQKDGPAVVKSKENVVDQVVEQLKALSVQASADIEALKKRKLVTVAKAYHFIVKKGPQFRIDGLVVQETDLNVDNLHNWKDLSFKAYNFNAKGTKLEPGRLHPLLKVRDEFRSIFLEMGFSEMPANQYVESSFWNFDALFQPQQHPARDAHDTFFLSSPATSDRYPLDYMERVKTVHSKGGYGSLGYGYDWKEAEAQKLILRTHTTAISSRMLYKLAQGPFKPVKWFSIDRVFRNETLDATHLAEFNQIEGVVADVGLTLGDLMGVLHGFFEKLGIKNLRFKPAYNPYTEPSMEIFAWHDGTYNSDRAQQVRGDWQQRYFQA